MTLPKTVQLAKLLPRLDRNDVWQLDEMLSAASELHTPGMPELEPFRTALLNLPPDKVRELRTVVDEHQRKARKEEERERVRGTSERPPAMNPDGAWTLRQEKVLCGKGNCQKLHGPYWYGYRTVGQKVKKRYFGKKRPTPAALEKAGAEILKKEIERLAAAGKKKKAAARR